MTATSTALLVLWQHIYGEQRGYIGTFTGYRNGGRELKDPQQKYFAYPDVITFAGGYLEEQAARGRDVYFCAHLLKDKRRVKENALPVLALYVDGDGATVPDDLPHPTAIVESSPGRHHYYWRLTQAIDPRRAEALNRRYAYAMAADPSGFDLTQLLRPPGMANQKYPDTTVKLVYLSEDAYDPDELERQLPAAPERPQQTIEPADYAGDEPPVRLHGKALKVWSGEWTVLKDDGDTDRSETLWAIAKELARAGATRSTIAAAVANRDQALGFYKYSGRRDGGLSQYEETAGRAIAAAHQEQVLRESIPLTTDREIDSATVKELLARIDQLETKVADLQSDNRRLREERSLFFDVLGNRELGLTAHTAFAVLFDHANKVSSGKDAEGWVRTSRERIAQQAGRSKESVSTDLKILEDAGVIERDVVRVPTQIVDPDTGEIKESYQSELRIRARAKPIDCLQTLVDFEKDTPRNWGGKRTPRCPEHPDAGVIIRREIRCAHAACNELLEEPTERFVRPEDLECQDSISEGHPDHVVNVFIGGHLDISDNESGVSSVRNAKLTAQPPKIIPIRERRSCVDCGQPCGTAERCSSCAAEATRSRSRS